MKVERRRTVGIQLVLYFGQIGRHSQVHKAAEVDVGEQIDILAKRSVVPSHRRRTSRNALVSIGGSLVRYGGEACNNRRLSQLTLGPGRVD